MAATGLRSAPLYHSLLVFKVHQRRRVQTMEKMLARFNLVATHTEHGTQGHPNIWAIRLLAVVAIPTL
jgi:hypothetical protein